MNGVKVLGLSMGMSHTLLVADVSTPELQAKVDSFDVYEP